MVRKLPTRPETAPSLELVPDRVTFLPTTDSFTDKLDDNGSRLGNVRAEQGTPVTDTGTLERTNTVSQEKSSG